MSASLALLNSNPLPNAVRQQGTARTQNTPAEEALHSPTSQDFARTLKNEVQRRDAASPNNEARLERASEIPTDAKGASPDIQTGEVITAPDTLPQSLPTDIAALLAAPPEPASPDPARLAALAQQLQLSTPAPPKAAAPAPLPEALSAEIAALLTAQPEPATADPASLAALAQLQLSAPAAPNAAAPAPLPEALPAEIAALLTAQPEPATADPASLAALPAVLAALSGQTQALPPMQAVLATATGAKHTAPETPAGPQISTLAAALLGGEPTENTTAGDKPAKSPQNAALLFEGARAQASQAGEALRSKLLDSATNASSAPNPALASAGLDLLAPDTQQQSGGSALAQAGGAQTSHAGLHAFLRPAAPIQPAVPQLPVATPAGQPAWAEDVGNQVHWMLGRAESKAELVLTPPNFGKMEVSISLNGDQATAQFIASTQAARDALEQALPRLREILQQAGISLGQTQVSTSGEQGAQHGQNEGNNRRGNAQTGGASELVSVSTPVAALRQHNGMVDTFA